MAYAMSRMRVIYSVVPVILLLPDWPEHINYTGTITL